MHSEAPDRSGPRRRGPGRPPGAAAREGRDTLLAAARALMAEKGLPGVTLREIAERAGVRPALAHYYFGSKDGLLSEVVAQVSDEMRERVEHILESEGSVTQRLRSLIRGWIAALAEDPYAPRLLVEQVLFAGDDVIESFVEHFGRSHLVALAELLAEGRASGELRDCDPRHLIPALAGIGSFYFLGAPVYARLFGEPGASREAARAYANAAADLVLRGITARPEADG